MTRTFTPDEIAVLIAKLEAATGPDCDLDEAIVRTLCPGAIISIYVQGDEEKTVFHAEPLVSNKAYVPHFTASIDAALSLVPEGMFRVAVYGRTRPEESLSSAFIFTPSDWINPIAEAEAFTVPLSICIAALKARASLARSNNES